MHYGFWCGVPVMVSCWLPMITMPVDRRFESWDEFACGNEVLLARRPETNKATEIRQRAYRLVKGDYRPCHVFRWNCEHFVALVVGENACRPQVTEFCLCVCEFVWEFNEKPVPRDLQIALRQRHLRGEKPYGLIAIWDHALKRIDERRDVAARCVHLVCSHL